MDTIEIILAVAIFLVFLGTWDNSGRIDQLQRRVMAHYDNPPASPRQEPRTIKEGSLPPTGPLRLMLKPDPITRPFSARLIEQKDEEIKNLKAELNKCKFDYACEVAGEKPEELEELRTLLFARVIKHRLDMQAKLKGFGAISLSKLKPEHYKRFKDYLLTLESDHV